MVRYTVWKAVPSPTVTDRAMTGSFATPDEAEQAFYEALAQGDLPGLMRVWADDEDIACIHPDGTRAHGQQAVCETWRKILGKGALVIHPSRTTVMPSTLTVVHVVLERVQAHTPQGPRQVDCYATNVYHKGRAGWHLILHHSSVAPDQAHASPLPPDVLH